MHVRTIVQYIDVFAHLFINQHISNDALIPNYKGTSYVWYICDKTIQNLLGIQEQTNKYLACCVEDDCA